MPLIRGIDVSGWQTVTSWAKVAADVEFVLIKATESTGYVSASFAPFTTGARAAGVLVGSYHFASATGRAADEADHYVTQLRRAGFTSGRDLPPMLDIERDGGRSKTSLTAWCLEFLHRVDTALELVEPWLKTGVYCNNEFRTNQFDGPRVLDGRWLMLASWPAAYRKSWPPESARPTGAAIWQFTDSGIGMVGGITGTGLDLDVARAEDLKNLAPLHYGDQPNSLEEDDVKLDDPVTLTPGEQTRGHYPDDTYSVRSLLVHAAIGGRQIAADLLPGLADVQSDLGKLAKPMPDADREKLAADIAAKVDSLRIQISHDLADDLEESK